tara:strand:+ start:2650 stop:3960 length:1311 start_codon:yes stop_codon:yes gene_type:complete
MSSAKISIWDTTVGYISWDNRNNTAIFESEKGYVDSPINIAPLLHPDKKELLFGNNHHEKFLGMIPTFNDSLPDSFGNVVFKEWLEQIDIDQSEMNPIERLLYVGKRGIGALEYHKGKDIPNITHNLDLSELSQISDKIIKRKYLQEDFIHNPDALRNILTIGSSVGGAQAKILVAITREQKKENEKILAGDIIHPIPVDYYIVKLEHDSQDTWYREKNYVEFVYNQIAKDIGINVTDSRLILEGGRAHFASKRFDRVNNRKIHKQTVNALTGFFGKNTEFSYEHIFRVMEYLKLPSDQKNQLFMQMVFNVVASNRDDHTKNFSFLMDEKGQWSFSPAYDLTFPFDPYQSFGIPHKISINNKVKGINREDLVVTAKKVGILNYNEIIDNIVDCVSTFSKRIKEYDLNQKTVQLVMADIEKNINRVKSSSDNSYEIY